MAGWLVGWLVDRDESVALRLERVKRRGREGTQYTGGGSQRGARTSGVLRKKEVESVSVGEHKKTVL